MAAAPIERILSRSFPDRRGGETKEFTIVTKYIVKAQNWACGPQAG